MRCSPFSTRFNPMRGAAVAIFVGAALAAAEPAQAQPSYNVLNRSLTDKVVIPAYTQLADAMARLDAETRSLCEDPKPSKLPMTKIAFKMAMDAWQRAQPISFGPIVAFGRAARVQFWPDKGGTGTRQVRRALKARNPDLIEKGGLRGRSVALQNIGTYERLLYGQGDEIASTARSERAAYACALAAAIASFQAELSAQMLDEWLRANGFRDAVKTAANGNHHFAGADEVATAYLKSLAGTLDAAIRLKLDRPLGASIDKARPKRTESWRSERSLENIRANLDTAFAFFSVSGGFADVLKANGHEAIAAEVRKSFETAQATAKSIDRPLHAAIAHAEARQQVVALRDQLTNLHLLIVGPMADALGLVVGFNALDGD